MNHMYSLWCNVVFTLLMCPPGISLQLPGTDLPEGYTTSFRSVLNLPMSVPTSPPKLPAKGAVSTGVYRNMFVEFGLSKASVQARVNQVGTHYAFDNFFLRTNSPRAFGNCIFDN